MSEFYELDDSLVVVRDENTYPIILTGATVPDGDAGYAKGCIFLKTDAGDGVSGVYFNKGTVADCDFELAPVASTGSVTDLTVSGTSTLTGAVGAASSITLGAGADLIGSSTSDITINTDKFTVAGATGNTLVAGTFEATGASTLTGAVTASGGIATTGAVTATEAITSSGATSGIGYATGAGGAVTQITSRSTGVTINAVSGTIQTDTTSLAAGASAEFTVTNSAVEIGDVVVVSQQSGSDLVAGVAGTTFVNVVTVAAGSFELSVNNLSTTTAETGAIIINFAVIKAVAA